MAATTLSAGDIAIIGFNFDNPDEFAFVLLRDIGSGTAITFTDNGWLSGGGFRSNEGILIWTANTDLSVGTVIKPTFSSTSFAFSTDGDQILAYQGCDLNLIVLESNREAILIELIPELTPSSRC